MSDSVYSPPRSPPRRARSSSRRRRTSPRSTGSTASQPFSRVAGGSYSPSGSVSGAAVRARPRSGPVRLDAGRPAVAPFFGGFLEVPVCCTTSASPQLSPSGRRPFVSRSRALWARWCVHERTSRAVDLPVVGFPLLGSAFGARTGAGATNVVAEDVITGYLTATLLAGSTVDAANIPGTVYEVEVLSTVSTVFVFCCAVREQRGRPCSRLSAP